MARLILLRHGESVWNLRNYFTGWVDVPLSQKGIEEALAAGEKIKDIPLDCVFVSSLIRSQMTAFLALSKQASGKVPILLHPEEEKQSAWEKEYGNRLESECIPMLSSWQLNERMYGELQGLNKQETIEKYGAEQVKIWRRSYDVAPPAGESLLMTKERTLPYFKEQVLPHLEKGETVLIAAHGNSLRSIVMEIENLSKEEVLSLEIKTGDPLFYRYEDGEIRSDES